MNPQNLHISDMSLGDKLIAKRELDELRNGVLKLFLLAGIPISIVWTIHVTSRGYSFGAFDLAAISSLFSVGASWLVSGKRHDIACWVYLLGMLSAQVLLLMSFPDSVLLCGLGLIWVVAANAMLGHTHALSACIVSATTVSMVLWRSGYHTTGQVVEIFALYVIGWATALATSTPLKTAAAWSMEAWRQGRELLSETRERRAELYRALRSLDEATYRIERMNNELLLARQQAEDAYASKSQLVSTVSHELRGPLNLILGFSQMITLYPEQYGQPLPEPYHADVDVIYRNSEHLAALIDDILDMSRIEIGRFPLIKERISFEHDVLEKVIGAVQSLADRKTLRLECQVKGPLPAVLADAVRLRQVLMNLVTNAVRFTFSGCITVHAETSMDSLQVSVSDTGPGIPAHEIPNLFKEFSQPGRTNTREASGTGLGLAISKRLIELHGGEIWVESRLGEGTTFSFSVPLRTGPDVVDGLALEPFRMRGHLHDTCLVVSNDHRFIRTVTRYVDQLQVFGLVDPADAVHTTSNLAPKAVITTDNLRSSVHAQLIKENLMVPLVTFDLSVEEESVEEDVKVTYLPKPIRMDMLRALMDGHRVQDELSILIVDDDKDFVRLLSDMLMLLPHPYHVMRAYTGAEAVDTMDHSAPDLVFLDLKLPDMLGDDVLSWMRQKEHLAGTSVVIVSAMAMDSADIALGSSISVYLSPEMMMRQGPSILNAVLKAAHPVYLTSP